jgi:hypothetical protein
MWLLDLFLISVLSVLSHTAISCTSAAWQLPFEFQQWTAQVLPLLCLSLLISSHVCVSYWVTRRTSACFYAYVVICPISYAVLTFWIYYGVIQILLTHELSQYQAGAALVYSAYYAVSSLLGFTFILVIPPLRSAVLALIFPDIPPKVTLSREELSQIPVKSADVDCCICREDSLQAQTRVLRCAHAFHSECIDPWLLKRSRGCPVCRKAVL